jgi:DNA-binding ferritin-like protein
MSPPPGRQLPTGELQAQLRDLLCLAVVGDHVRWVVAGDGSADLADWLSEATEAWRASADEVAKRLVSSGDAPDGRVRSLAKDVALNWVPDGWLTPVAARQLVAERLTVVSDWARYRRAESSGADRTLLERVCTTFEAQLETLGRLDAAHEASDANAPIIAP